MKRTPLKRGQGLKRGSAPLRRTPLKSSTPLQSNSTLERGSGLKNSAGSGMKRTEFKNKPRQMSPEEVSCRKIVKTRSEGTCEICGVRPASDMAHRRARSQGGPWTPSNMLHACRKCHSENHANPTYAYEQGWHVKSSVDWKEQPAYLAQFGWVVLDDDGGFTSQ